MNEYNLFHILGNKNRVSILRELAKEDHMTFSDLSFNLRMNPKLVRDYTRILIDAGIIIKSYPGYRLTSFGSDLMLIFEDMWVKISILITPRKENKTDVK